MNFEEAKLQSEKLNSAHHKTATALKEYEKGLGHIAGNPLSDSIRALPEWQKLRKASDKAFGELRTFNAWYVKEFKKELREDREKRKSEGTYGRRS
jgi:hypothetical protein